MSAFIYEWNPKMIEKSFKKIKNKIYEKKMNVSCTSKKSKVVFILSIIVSVFWVMGQSFNVYYFAVVGAIFEILWLPMIALLIILPIVSLIYLVKEKFNLKSLFLYSFLILTAAFLYISLRN
jgi:hypothetical protein